MKTAHVLERHMHWWNNTDIYNLSESDVLQLEQSLMQLER